MSGVLAVLEQRDGALHKMALEALAAAQQIGAALDLKVFAAIPGAAGSAETLTGYKLDKIHVIEHELLKDYTPDGYTLALKQLIEKFQPTFVLFPHTYQVRDFAPKLATAMGRVLVSDVIANRIEDGKLVLVRQLFQGKINADVHFEGEPPYFASVQAGAFRADTLLAGTAAVDSFPVELKPEQIRTKPLELFSANRSAPSISPPPTSSFPWAAASKRPTTFQSSKRLPTHSEANWRPRAPFATMAGFRWNAR